MRKFLITKEELFFLLWWKKLICFKDSTCTHTHSHSCAHSTSAFAFNSANPIKSMPQPSLSFHFQLTLFRSSRCLCWCSFCANARIKANQNRSPPSSSGKLKTRWITVCIFCPSRSTPLFCYSSLRPSGYHLIVSPPAIFQRNFFSKKTL